LRIDGIAPFSDILENQAPEYVLLLVFSALLVYGLFSFIVYAFSLDPFRSDRPRALVYLNFLPLGFFVGMIYLLSVSGSRSGARSSRVDGRRCDRIRVSPGAPLQ
jgi:hypothetical protein